MVARTYPCFECGHVATTPKESMSHATDCRTDPAGITRPVHCHACAGEIDLRAGATCPTCGATYPVAMMTGTTPRGNR